MNSSLVMQNSEVVRNRPVLQAFQILHIGFTVAPILFGLDKFTNWLVDWSSYLSPLALAVLPMSGDTFRVIVGVVEIVAGLVVFFKPRYGGYLVAVWLWGIILNLLLVPGFFDVALRDFGLSLAALALARLAEGVVAE